jgi:hypothetical protein
MKTIIILSFLLILTSCEKKISGDEIKSIIQKCEKNDGIKYINIMNTDMGLAQCNNNILFQINQTRNDTIEPESALKREQIELCLEICSNNEGLGYISYFPECIKWDGEYRKNTCIEYVHKYNCFCDNEMFGKL